MSTSPTALDRDQLLPRQVAFTMAEVGDAIELIAGLADRITGTNVATRALIAKCELASQTKRIKVTP